MSSHRMLRVSELLKREIGETIRRELPLDQAGMITVNDVEVSGDLGYATVFVSFLGSQEQQRVGLKMLLESRLRIQDLVAKAVILKKMPKLRFKVDDSIVRGNRVLEILEDLERQQKEP